MIPDYLDGGLRMLVACFLFGAAINLLTSVFKDFVESRLIFLKFLLSERIVSSLFLYSILSRSIRTLDLSASRIMMSG